MLSRDLLPEFELGETANERSILIRSTSRKRPAAERSLGIFLRGEEGDDEVQKVDSDCVGDDVEAFHQVDANEVDQHDDEAGDPSVENVRHRLVEKMLLALLHGVDQTRGGVGWRRCVARLEIIGGWWWWC